jgi:hypothetical protein
MVKWIENGKGKCTKISGHVHIFAEPPNNEPLSLLRGLFGPIADLQRKSPDAQLVVWPYEIDHPFKKFLGTFKNLRILNTSGCNCFEGTTWHLANSDNIASFRASFSNPPPEPVVTFILASGATIENASALANTICEGCTPLIFHVDDDVDLITAGVLKSKGLVSELVDFLGWAFLLEKGSTLAVMSEGTLSNPWLVEFVGFLHLMFTVLEIKKIGNVITVL